MPQEIIGLDTNILVRLIVADDQGQLKKVKKLILEYNEIPGSLFINNIVLCELIWVLKKGYKYPKKQLLVALEALLATKEIAFENRNLINHAVNYYRNGKADFSDYLTLVINSQAGCANTYSFDTKIIAEKLFTRPA